LPLDKERRKAYNKAYYLAHKKKLRRQMRAWRELNREKHLAYLKAWHLANREKHNAQVRAWKISHPEKVRAYREASNRRRRIKNPFSSSKDPRAYSAWYHTHHPGYFAKKTGEWLSRQPKSKLRELFKERNTKNRKYTRLYCRLRYRLRRSSSTPLALTSEEREIMDRSRALSEMFGKVSARKTGRDLSDRRSDE